MKKLVSKAPLCPKDSPSSPGGLICVVCGKPFERAPNNAVKAKVCTPFGASHYREKKKGLDGTIKLLACTCCRCVYKTTLAKQRSVEGKVMPLGRIVEFVKTSEKMYGADIALAFRTAINAMLRVKELASLEVSDLNVDAKPLPTLIVVALKKKVRMRYPVDIDVKMAKDLSSHLGDQKEGLIFDVPIRTLQHKYKQVAKAMGFGQFSIHSLRHTGIANRGQHITNFNELEYLRKQARHESIETTKLYLGLETQQRLEISKRISWA